MSAREAVRAAEVELLFPGGRLRAEVADDEPSRRRGLSGRPPPAPGRGLLLAFDEPGSHPLWTRGVHFPIDVAYLDGCGVVLGVDEGVPPGRDEEFGGEYEARWVAEGAAGWVGDLGVRSGQRALFATRAVGREDGVTNDGG